MNNNVAAKLTEVFQHACDEKEAAVCDQVFQRAAAIRDWCDKLKVLIEKGKELFDGRI